jgi:transposase, IS6 family
MRRKRPALFRGRHFADEIIVLCVRWYLRYSLSYRDLTEIMCERNLSIDPSTIWRVYRAVDSTGATIDFLLSESRDLTSARRFFQKALTAPGHPRPRVINVDGNPSYPTVIQELKQCDSGIFCQARAPVSDMHDLFPLSSRAFTCYEWSLR